MSDLTAAERELKVQLMIADIKNKNADSAYKEGLLRYEPWKVAAAGFAAGAGLLAAAIALLGALVHLFGH